MSELYVNMGFRENPFSRFSAEEEKEYLGKIFVQPKYYHSIHDDIKAGASRFVFGERGVGKSALVLNLIADFDKECIFSVLIDDYEGINKSDNGKDLVALTLNKIITSYGLFLLKNKSLIRGLNKDEKEKLTFFVNTFFVTLSKAQFFDLYNRTTHMKSLNLLKRIFNILLLKPINTVLSGCSELIGNTICKALGLTAPVSDAVYREYISELKDTAIIDKIDPKLIEYKTLKNMLIEVTKIIKKCGFSNVVIIYDKIDEYRQLCTNTSLVADFVKDLALDTALLLNEHFSMVFSFWSRIKTLLSDLGVRYDKLKPIDISWTTDELKRIINDRLRFFSGGNVTSLENIMPANYIDTVLELSNQSPRHLIILLSKIYDEQATRDDNNKSFSSEAVTKGLANFAQTFDFSIFYAGSNPATIKKTVKELVKVHKIEFETKDLIDTFKISSQAANNKIKTMFGYGLIEDITAGSRAKRYRIIEPRIRYMIQNI